MARGKRGVGRCAWAAPLVCVLLTICACGGGESAGQPSPSPSENAGGRQAPTPTPISLLAKVLAAGPNTLLVCVLPASIKPPADNSCPRGSLSRKDGVRCAAVAQFVRSREPTGSPGRVRSPQGPWDLAEQPSGSGGIQFTLDGATGPEPDFPRRTTWRYDVTCASSASRVRTSGQFDQN